MGVHVGGWIYSDTLRALDVQLQNADKTVFDATGYTAVLEVLKPGEQTLAATVAMSSWVGGIALGKPRFLVGAVAALQPATAGATERYFALVKLTAGTDILYAGDEPFEFTIRRWP